MQDRTSDGAAGRIPEHIGGYRVLSRLGSGGMGEVFLARSPLGQLAAVKVIRPELLRAPGFRERFAREVAAARRVTGPHTAVLIDADTEAERPWLATLYLPAPTLEQAVAAHGPLPLSALRTLAAGLTCALSDVHRAGLVHRDVKPSNVLLALDGPCLIDFGIARALEDTPMTTAGMLLGSPGFMAPEQIEGAPPVGPATDVFCLAAVLVFAATGSGPFGEGPQLSMLYRVVETEPRLDQVPDELRPLLARALAKNPADRPTPERFAEQLGPTLLGQPGWLPPPVLSHIRALARADATASGTPEPLPYDAALPLTLGTALPGTRGNNPSGEIETTAAREEPVPFDAPASGPVLLSARPSPATTGTGTGTSGSGAESREDAGAGGARAARSHRATPLLRRRAFLVGCGGIAAATAGTYFALESGNHHASAGTGTGGGTADTWTPARFAHRTGGPVHSSPGFSGASLYIGSDDGRVYALESRTGAARWTFAAQDIVWSTPALADGAVYVNSYDHRVYALDAITGRPRWTFTTGDRCCSSPIRFGPLLLFGSHDRNVYALDAATGQVRWKYATGDIILSSPTVADGVLYVGSFDGCLYALDAATGAARWKYQTQGSIWSSPTARDGTVYVGSNDGSLYAVTAATGRGRWKHATGNKIISSPAVASGRVHVGSEDGRVYALDTADGSPVWTLRTGSPIDSSPSVASGVLYIGGGDGFLYALDPATGAVVHRYPVGAAVWGTPIVQGRTVYVGSLDSQVYALPTPV